MATCLAQGIPIAEGVIAINCFYEQYLDSSPKLLGEELGLRKFKAGRPVPWLLRPFRCTPSKGAERPTV